MSSRRSTCVGAVRDLKDSCGKPPAEDYELRKDMFVLFRQPLFHMTFTAVVRLDPTAPVR